MATSLHNLFQSLFLLWLQSNSAPEAPIEGTTPEFASWLNTQPNNFTFDALLHSTPSPNWAWQSVEFSDIFDGRFFFYLPKAWSETQHAQARAVFSAEQTQQQSISLLPNTYWQAPASDILAQSRVVAFAYSPLWRPHYHQWIFVTTRDTMETTVYGVYSSGTWLIVVEGAVPSGTHPNLSIQLAALVNSNPWYGWIQAAKAQQS